MACVYILRSGEENLFKIGRAADFEKRKKTLATGNPHPLTPYALIETEHAASCEAFIHHLVQSRRSTRSEAREFFELEPAELDELIRAARTYNDEVLPKKHEAERLAEEHDDDRMLEPGESERHLHRELLELRERRDRLNFECERLENELKLAIGTAAGLEGIATWKAHSMTRFDQEAFAQQYPDLHDEFMRESWARSFRLL